MTREAFITTRAKREGLIQARVALTTTGFNRDAAARVREYKPRWKDDSLSYAWRRLEPWEYKCLLAPVIVSYRTMTRDLDVEIHWLDTCLDRLAAATEPQTGAEWTLHQTVHGSSYSTQGLGADRYAQNAAQQHVDHFVAQGLAAEVRRKQRPRPEYPGRFYVHTSDWEVWVKAEPADIEIARRRPGTSLREWVRMCWARGVNPRVYNPYLPPGLEEKLGLDYFGKDLRR